MRFAQGKKEAQRAARPNRSPLLTTAGGWGGVGGDVRWKGGEGGWGGGCEQVSMDRTSRETRVSTRTQERASPQSERSGVQ